MSHLADRLAAPWVLPRSGEPPRRRGARRHRRRRFPHRLADRSRPGRRAMRRRPAGNRAHPLPFPRQGRGEADRDYQRLSDAQTVIVDAFPTRRISPDLQKKQLFSCSRYLLLNDRGGRGMRRIARARMLTIAVGLMLCGALAPPPNARRRTGRGTTRSPDCSRAPTRSSSPRKGR